MESSSKSEVAAVGEGSDDKTTSVAKVLVAIDKLGIDSSDEQLILPIVPTAQVQLETINNWKASRKRPLKGILLPLPCTLEELIQF